MTRLAPSPTGALHLGNARTFLLNWAMARRAGWRVVLRIEDLDGPRVKPESIEGTVEILRWLGLDWDEGPVLQSTDLEVYVSALRALASRALAYPCALTRSEIAASLSAPQEGVHEQAFPVALRPLLEPREVTDRSTNWRFVVEEETVTFRDEVHGVVSTMPSSEVGDFVVWTKAGVPSYQLAVVVDDARQGVTRVVRGDDLISSTGRQMLLQRALGLPSPGYTHLPLVVGADGRRLAKRHGDTRLETYREAGVSPERVIGLLAGWSGMDREPMDASSFLAGFMAGFDLARMSRSQVVFGPEDDEWLRS